VPRYDFRCRQCSATFEVDRPMAAASDPARCPAGHADTVKLLSTVALGRGSGAGRAGAGRAPVPAAPTGGGCCGGGCCG
jgi:putative FmdB family regulatory protein